MKISDDFVERNIRGELILVPISGDEDSLDSLFTLNKSATTIWESLKSGKNIEETVNILKETYEIDTYTAKNDVEILISKLQTLGAITSEDA